MTCRVIGALLAGSLLLACAEQTEKETPARGGSEIPNHFADGKALSAKRALWRAQWKKQGYLSIRGCEDAGAGQVGCRALTNSIDRLRKLELDGGQPGPHRKAAADSSIAASLYATRLLGGAKSSTAPRVREASAAEMQALLRLAGYLQTGSRADKTDALVQLKRVTVEGKPSAVLRQVLDDSSLMEPDPELKRRTMELRRSLGD